jgi:hypothetical protein
MDNNDNESAVTEAREKAAPSFMEVSRQILDLLPTLEDALNRMSIQLDELKIESSTELFGDFGKTLVNLSDSLPVVFFENDAIEKINPHIETVFKNITTLVEKYEAGEIVAIKSYLNSELLPNFKILRQELETSLHKAFPPS